MKEHKMQVGTSLQRARAAPGPQPGPRSAGLPVVHEHAFPRWPPTSQSWAPLTCPNLFPGPQNSHKVAFVHRWLPNICFCRGMRAGNPPLHRMATVTKTTPSPLQSPYSESWGWAVSALWFCSFPSILSWVFWASCISKWTLESAYQYPQSNSVRFQWGLCLIYRWSYSKASRKTILVHFLKQCLESTRIWQMLFLAEQPYLV